MTPQALSRAFSLSLLGLIAALSPLQAEPGVFVISSAEGYGISDCFAGKAACGKAISDAYCQSQGFAEASAFGLAADLTATISVAQSPRSRGDDLVIACQR
jgi:hypothetical protein